MTPEAELQPTDAELVPGDVGRFVLDTRDARFPVNRPMPYRDGLLPS